MNAVPKPYEPPALHPVGGLFLSPLDFPPLRVLVVDDNRDASDSLGKLLGMVGFRTRVYHDAMSALNEIEQFQPEACILDISMPEIDGCALARVLRALPGGNELLLVAVTALGSLEAQERIAAAGFDRHIVKPADPQTILDILFDFEQQLRVAPLVN